MSKGQTLVCFILRVGVHVVYVKQKVQILVEREYRCCKDLGPARRLMVSDGSTRISGE